MDHQILQHIDHLDPKPKNNCCRSWSALYFCHQCNRKMLKHRRHQFYRPMYKRQTDLFYYLHANISFSKLNVQWLNHHWHCNRHLTGNWCNHPYHCSCNIRHVYIDIGRLKQHPLKYQSFDLQHIFRNRLNYFYLHFRETYLKDSPCTFFHLLNLDIYQHHNLSIHQVCFDIYQDHIMNILTNLL